jgi:D-sedoheptulose 7-phosphate isomerase
VDDISSLLKKIRKARYVFLIGNGGSYANAQHIANDLIACGVKAFTADPATLTATANDYGYEKVFSTWLRVVGSRGDLLIALSGSGTSRNIVLAIDAAKSMGIDTHLVTDYLRTRDMQQSEEDQLVLGHELMRRLRGPAT